jgi:hypothetical protein
VDTPAKDERLLGLSFYKYFTAKHHPLKTYNWKKGVDSPAKDERFLTLPINILPSNTILYCFKIGRRVWIHP